MSVLGQDYDKVLEKLEPNSFDKKQVLLFTKEAKVYKWYNSEYEFRSGISWLKTLELSESDEVIYGVGIDKLQGYMLFAFSNGKVAKINLSAYDTKTERKQLLNAFNTEATLIFIKYVSQDIDIMLTGSSGKALIINTSIINPLDTKSSRGVQILKLKPSTHAEKVYLLDEIDIQDVSYYKRDAAAVGYYLKPEDRLIKKEFIQENIG